MRKIMVMGVSAGAGKSTFARQLGDVLQIGVYHLDTLFWKPGWVQAEDEEFAAGQRKIVHNQEQWIIEGNYTGTYDIRAEAADTVIYLELPIYICLYRVVKRWLKYRGKTRPDLGEGCPDKLDWEFIRFICTTYYPRKKKMKERLRLFQVQGNEVYFLKRRKEIQDFLAGIKGTIE